MSRARSARRPELGARVTRAQSRFVRVPPRKLRLIADIIRGLSVDEARQQLAQLNRPSAAPTLMNLLKSAVANVERQIRDKEYDGETGELVLGRIDVDSGPMLKRFQPRALGRATMIRKRMSHVTLELYEEA